MAGGVRKARSGISALAVCVYVLKGVIVITWPAAHKTEEQTQGVRTLGHSRGDRMKVVCLYNMGVVKCQNVSCEVCESVW